MMWPVVTIAASMSRSPWIDDLVKEHVERDGGRRVWHEFCSRDGAHRDGFSTILGDQLLAHCHSGTTTVTTFILTVPCSSSHIILGPYDQQRNVQ